MIALNGAETRLLGLIVFLALLLPCQLQAVQEENTTEPEELALSSDLPVDSIPDLRDDDLKLKVGGGKDRNFFAVPIPMSSPTFGTGLILGGAYF